MHNIIKYREIYFDPMHPDPRQAQSAMFLFSDVLGIEHVAASSPLQLIIHYDITHITLTDILAVLLEHGFHLDASITSKLKQALYQYTEETQRANMGITGKHTTRDIFMTRHKRRPHGCRDHRPSHWRQYR